MGIVSQVRAKLSKEEWHGVELIMILLASAALVFALFFLFLRWPTEQDAATAGQLGDHFGGHLAAAGSLVAAFLFFAALNMQRRDLRLTREEMKAARVVAQEQAESIEIQTTIAADSSVKTSALDAARLAHELHITLMLQGSRLSGDAMPQQFVSICDFIRLTVIHSDMPPEQQSELLKACGIHTIHQNVLSSVQEALMSCGLSEAFDDVRQFVLGERERLP